MFGERLNSLLKARDLKQAKVAASLGVTQAAVSRWLNGSVPGGDTLVALARLLDTTAEQFFVPQGQPMRVMEERAAYRPSPSIDLEEIEAIRSALTDALARVDKLAAKLRKE